MIVKVLVENNIVEHDLCTTDGLSCEHGLCLYVEYQDKKYLVDSGASDLFATNADKMGVDLDQINMAFLSHAHYDHSGGYARFFEKNQHAKLYMQKASQYRQYFKIAGPIKKYIGIPDGILDTFDDRIEYVDGAATIDEGVYIVPHSLDGILERAKHTHMCVVVDGKVQYDDFKHEQTVVFDDEDGLICFNSCSHSGVDIIVKEVQQAFPDKKIKAYVGGFHMMGITGADSCSYKKEEVQQIARELAAATDATFYTGHCTGTIAFEWLKEILGDRVQDIHTGRVFEI